MSSYTITWKSYDRNSKITINGMPNKPIRAWNSNIKIKFYDRYTSRQDTQLFINGKYFLNFKGSLNEDAKTNVEKNIKVLYMLGVNLDGIKGIYKKLIYNK